MGRGSSVLLVPLMFSISFIGSMAFRTSMPAVTFYTRRVLEASALGVGLLTSSFFAARASFSVITGGLADRLGRRIVYAAVLCFLLNGLAVQLYLMVNSVPAVLGVRFLQGVLNGVAWVSIQFVLGRSVSESVRGRVYAVYFAIGSLGIVSGNLLYSLLSDHPMSLILDVSSALYIVTALLAIQAGLLLRGVEEFSGEVGRATTAGRARGLALTRAVPLMIIVLGTTFFSSMVRGDLIYIYINEAFNVSEASTAQIIALASFTALAGGYLLSWMSDSLGDVLALKVALVVGVVGGVIMGAKSLHLAVAGLILFYVANSGVIPVSRRIAITKYRLGGTTLGLVNASGNIGAVIGASILGYLYDMLGYASISLWGFKLSVLILISASTLLVSIAASLTLLGDHGETRASEST